MERNLKKSWEIFEELVQNFSKTNFGTVFKNNEILRKILQDLKKYSQSCEKLLMIFYKEHEKMFRKWWEPLKKCLANVE